MTTSTLVDTNVLIDVLGPAYLEARQWSLSALRQSVEDGSIVFSVVVWAELSKPSLGEEALVHAFSWLEPSFEDLPFAAAYPAGAARDQYRRRGGRRERTMPDFLIGAHALVCGHRLLTRDAARYRSYFPELNILGPETFLPESPA